MVGCGVRQGGIQQEAGRGERETSGDGEPGGKVRHSKVSAVRHHKHSWNPPSLYYIIPTYWKRLLLLNPRLSQRKGWRFQQQTYPCAFLMPRVTAA